jgi:hypothetical protein
LKLKPRLNHAGFHPASSAKFTGAVPLGDATTGGRPQQPEIQHPLDFRGGVAVNLASKAYFFDFRAGPDLFHGSLLFLMKRAAEAVRSFLSPIIRVQAEN